MKIGKFEETVSNKLLNLAGIFEKSWIGDEDIYSFSIITVEASADFSNIHHRMPALLGLSSIIFYSIFFLNFLFKTFFL